MPFRSGKLLVLSKCLVRNCRGRTFSKIRYIFGIWILICSTIDVSGTRPFHLAQPFAQALVVPNVRPCYLSFLGNRTWCSERKLIPLEGTLTSRQRRLLSVLTSGINKPLFGHVSGCYTLIGPLKHDWVLLTRGSLTLEAPLLLPSLLGGSRGAHKWPILAASMNCLESASFPLSHVVWSVFVRLLANL